jgi:D-glycero-beta-D-manno-heptose 1-phosphate adenylyltransferase
MIHCTTAADLQALCLQWKAAGDKIVFTNGVFDILHQGHVTYLEKARELGDRLVVAINDDTSVRQLNKGAERPINPELARARVVGALRCVDATIVFKEDTPLNTILAIMPDVLVKGGDYNADETDPQSKSYIVGSSEVRASGGRVVAIDLVPGFSTTGIVKKLQG